MSNKQNIQSFSKAVHALIIAVSALVFFCLVHFLSTHAFKRINIEGVFPESGVLKVYYAKMPHGFAPNLAFDIEIEGSEQPQIISEQLNNRIMHKLRFDFSSIPISKLHVSKQISIKEIVLEGFFQARPTKIELSGLTLSEGENSGVSYTKGELIISDSESEINVRSFKAEKHYFVHYFLPVFLALVFWLFMTSVNWRLFPAIEDLLSNQQSRNVNNLRSLDGLRGIAALTVLLEHTMPSFIGLGRAGVWLFFVLSGFLLVRSFILNPERMMTVDGLRMYFLKRIKRVLPMFYFMVTIVFLLRGKVGSATRHYLLIQGDGHFWTVLHELYFYMFLPLIACSVYLLFKQKYLWTMVVLILLALAWYYLASPDLVSLYGLGRRHTPYFYVFFVGMTAGYFYYGVYQSSERVQRYFTTVNKPLSVFGLILMLVLFFYASNLRLVEEHIAVWDYPFLSAILAAMLVLMSAVTSEAGLYNRILSLSLLRLVGIVGYSFYLIHPYAIAIFKGLFEFVFAVSPSGVLPSVVILLGSFFIALPIAMFTYSYIERPFLKNKN